MALKRKRSSDGFSPTSTSSFLSTTTYGSQSPTPAPRVQFTGSMVVDGPVPSNSITAWTTGIRKPYSSDLNSRTRKRFRDNRPDESVIYASSLRRKENIRTRRQSRPNLKLFLQQPHRLARSLRCTRSGTYHLYTLVRFLLTRTLLRSKSHKDYDATIATRFSRLAIAWTSIWENAPASIRAGVAGAKCAIPAR
ncbi:hypothetical protein H2201_006632 [Coniosporium apollinis]|uniref:Uncharacterized protein n=2 Tax=Coniosporium TaxID=2810619 RepID=A0ABQ9NLF8_9PEZI|nr:hypothetical protein H2199_003901 [Cladosporium sp. JES 115]KAJ9661083.1 hypothetical protein H2201_006632 [Coniosporium apollinis]